MPRIRYTSEVKITETKDGFFIASLIINGVINHSTYPQRSKQNAILLINRQIERFNAINEVRLPLYGQKQRAIKYLSLYLQGSSPLLSPQHIRNIIFTTTTQ